MKKQRKVKIVYTAALLSALFSLASFFYPVISDSWNRYVASQIIYDYQKNEADEKDYNGMLLAAKQYNKRLYEEGLQDEKDADYEDLLNVNGDGMMGYLTIESLDLSLPFYHHTSDEILEKGIGHLHGSSLPVGGESTHAVLTGHCGLMSARLFTDLEKLKIGDFFYVDVLGNQLFYRIDQIKTVLPDSGKYLSIEKGNDYVTLVTCTPYGINTHRLLVRGRRIAKQKYVSSENDSLKTVKHLSRSPAVVFLICLLVLLCTIKILFNIWRRGENNAEN